MVTRATKKRSPITRKTHSPTYASSVLASLPKPLHPTGTWATEEHDRFLQAMALYPKGPWKDIADHVATRTVRQVQTHAQKYQEKVERHVRGLRKPKKKQGDDDDDEDAKSIEVGHRVVMGTYSRLGNDKRATRDGQLAFRDGAALQTDSDSSFFDSETESLASEESLDREGLSTVSHPKQPLELGNNMLDEDTSSGATELAPGWIYLDDINDGEGHEQEASPDLPSLGESLDFLIEYLTICPSSPRHGRCHVPGPV